MEALADRLTQLDSHVEGAIRVVAFYDTLMRRRVDPDALARASAGLAECVAGSRLHATGQVIRMAPDGRPAPVPVPAPVPPSTGSSTPVSAPPPVPAPATAPAPALASTTLPVLLDEEEIGAVWLERPGAPEPLDDVLLDRFSIALAAAVERYGPTDTAMADPALVELVISADSDDPARARALRLLGFAASPPVQVVALRSEFPLDRIGDLVSPGRPVKAARLADTDVLLSTGVDPDRFPPGIRAGIGAAESPDRSWWQARTALRFTSPREPVLRYDALGALALLAELPQASLRANADVAALGRLAEQPSALETLDVYCAAGSVRRAAELLHLHHSSVGRRIEQIGRALGIGITEPDGLLRARIALAARRLLDG